jgi:hypothetical protein
MSSLHHSQSLYFAKKRKRNNIIDKTFIIFWRLIFTGIVLCLAYKIYNHV